MTHDSWVRLASRSFPRRWRAERGQELIETTADLAPGASRPSLRILLDIVFAGLRERHRTRPPFFRWLWYSMGGKLPREWHAWMRDDLTGRWFWLRDGFRRAVPVFVVLFAIRLVGHQGGWVFPLSYPLATIVVSAAMARSRRDQTWKRNGYEPGGESWAKPGPFLAWTATVPPQPSHPVVPSLRAAGWALISTSLAWLYGAAYPHESFRVPGMTFRHDPNSPITRTGVVGFAGVALVVVIIVGPLLSRRFGRKHSIDRPEIDALAPIRRAGLHAGLFALVACVAFLAGIGIFPAMATAALGASGLAVGGCSAFVGVRCRRSRVTWADLAIRPKASPVPAQR
jgi:hypothetical protein